MTSTGARDQERFLTLLAVGTGGKAELSVCLSAGLTKLRFSSKKT